MTQKKKRAQQEEDLYGRRLEIFPDKKESAFEQEVCDTIRKIITRTVEKLERPTIKAIAAELGMMRARVTRIIAVMDMDDWYKKRKVEKMKAAKLSRELGGGVQVIWETDDGKE